MNLFMQLLRDEQGFVLSAEAMLLGTVGVIGATVGLSAVARSVNDELADVAMAFRSIDQSFHIEGASSCGACVAGSSFTQQPVEESLKQLRHEIKKGKAREQQLLDEAAKNAEKQNEKAQDKEGDPQPPASGKPHERRRKHKKHADREEDDADERDDAHDMKEDMDETSI